MSQIWFLTRVSFRTWRSRTYILMRHLRTSLKHVRIAVWTNRNRYWQGVIHATAHSVWRHLVPLHHHLKIFVDFVVFCFGARRQRVTVVRLWRFWWHCSILILFLWTRSCKCQQTEFTKIMEDFPQKTIKNFQQELSSMSDDEETNWRRKKVNYFTSIMFLLVNDSCGSLYSVYLSKTLSISVLAYWYSLLLLENIINAISQSHNTDSSYAFFITPNFLLLNVT